MASNFNLLDTNGNAANSWAWNSENILAPLLSNQFASLMNNGFNQDAARARATEAATPQGRGQISKQFRTNAMADANEQGRRLAARVRAMGGGPNASIGALIGSQNAATEAGNRFASQNESPLSVQQSLANAMNLNSPSQILSILPILMGVASSQSEREALLKNIQKSQGGGGLGGILGSLIGGGLIPWASGQIFGGK